ncbi:MAG: cysteine--tRNA ligase, partial [Candidatus Methanomethylicota archaeon]
MVLQVYNTLTRKKEIFKPLDPNIVKIYVCGPTVYDKTHIGHARTYVTFDVIRRYLEFKGFNVFYVVNITDIEDKIIAKSLKTGKSWKEVADEYTADFFKAVDALNIKRAHIYPRVSEHIEDIIHFIEKLIEKGHAYEAEGNVYFDVDSFSDYGKLSNISRDQLKPQEEGPGKKNPYDFALWKKAKPGEPYWQSPWGPGRPGWHIECSVMSSKYLGAQFDIHGGGQDLIFPHHENEIAQSEAYFGVNPWVKYWLHTGMLIMGTEKMSKSIGNVITVEEILKSYKPMEVRFYLLSCHYRSQLAFSDEALKHAKAAYNKILNAISSLQSILS